MLDTAFTETLFSPGTTHITGLAWAPDGSSRLFYTRKSGQIRVIENGVDTLFASAAVVKSSECGMLGIAFDPAFVDNQFVYAFATVSATEQQIIRYTAAGKVGVEPTVIVAGLPTRGANHDGGAIGFGPDGKLYWAVGDNGNRTGVDSDLSSLAAKIGRANGDGSVPNDNPFVDGSGPNNDYIWARGFRNPFSFTFDPKTGQLWVDVAGDAYEQIFSVSAGDHAGWDNYESNQPAGFVPPVISYRNDAVDIRPIASAVRAGGEVTFATTVPHRFRPGAKIVVAEMADATFNAIGFVKTVPSATQFVFAQTGGNAASAGGTASSQAIGGAVTGGIFWDSSGVPAGYQGNFMFGDYNSGRLMRAKIDAQGQVAAVDEWGDSIVNYVDMDVGADGALYYATTKGSIYRAAYNHTQQGLIVSRLHVRIAEGSGVGFAVSLAVPPPQKRTVLVQRKSGDPDVSVGAGATLVFDASNWSVPQAVRLTASQDSDSLDDLASVSVSSNGLATQTVSAAVTDDDGSTILLSTTGLALVEGESSVVGVSLSEPPTSTLTLTVAVREPATLEVSSTSLSFDAANWNVPQAIAVGAMHDDDATDDEDVIDIAGDGLPTRELVVTVSDDDASAPLITTAPLSMAIVGATYRYDVDASGVPAVQFSLDQAPDGMVIDGASGILEWSPLVTSSAVVRVRASNGIVPDDVQDFEVQVVEDQPPVCDLTRPQSGEVISGALAEFFGDVVDDVGAVGATFFVDGAVAFADAGPDGHYHFGAAHNQFDTTTLADGTHVLGMTGEDTAGQTCSVEVSVVIDNQAEGGAAGAPADALSGGAGPGAPFGEGGSPDGSQPAESGRGGEEDDGTPSTGSDESMPQASAPGADGCDCRIMHGRHEWESGGLILVVVSSLLRRRSARRRRVPVGEPRGVVR